MNILFLTLSMMEYINQRGIYTDPVRGLSNKGINMFVVSTRQKHESLPIELSTQDNVKILKLK